MVVAFLFLGQAAQGQDLLKEYGDLLVGRWIGQVKLIADWPGFAKQGDNIVSHGIVRWTVDKKALEGEWLGGNGQVKSIIFWDVESSKLKEIRVDSGGTVTEAFISKKDGKWVIEGSGRLLDGTKFQGSGTIEVSDDGNTQTLTGKFTMGGKDLPDWKDVYKRASH
jgi:hypothetical protein